MYLNIDINLDNAAFGDIPEEEVARILEEYVKQIKMYGLGKPGDRVKLRDINGNEVGQVKVCKI